MPIARPTCSCGPHCRACCALVPASTPALARHLLEATRPAAAVRAIGHTALARGGLSALDRYQAFTFTVSTSAVRLQSVANEFVPRLEAPLRGAIVPN